MAGDGKAQWQVAYSPEKGQCPTAMTLANVVLYFGGGGVPYAKSKGRLLWSLEAATGKELWRYRAKPETYSDGECVTAPAVSDGTVVTTAEHVIYALDAGTGALRWKREGVRTVNGQPKQEQLSEPLITGGVVYSYMNDGLTGWDLKTGNPVFDLPDDFGLDPGSNRMAAAGGVLFFLANLADNQGPDASFMPLYAMDLSTKQILWKHRVNRPSPYDSIGRWTMGCTTGTSRFS